MNGIGYGIRDGFDHGEGNVLHCTCGERLWPDCDVSAASICDEFERHLIDAHGFTRADIAMAGRERGVT